MGQRAISVETVGVFRVVSRDGEDLTPPGNFPRAVFAAIALSRNLSVSRRWLESLIWSDREPEQASGSLRQALASLRKSLGRHASVLKSGRVDVSLNRDDVEIDLLDREGEALAALARGRGLLEGIDVPAEPFEDWLRCERAALRDRLDGLWRSGDAAEGGMLTPDGKSARLPELYLYPDNEGRLGPLESFFTHAICAQLARTIGDVVRTEASLFDGFMANAIAAPGSRCRIRVTESRGRMLVLARLFSTPSSRLVWQRMTSFEAGDDDAAVDAAASISFSVGEAMAAHMGKAGNAARANAMAANALQDVFSFDAERIRRADRMLETAHELDPHAPRPALRALALAFLAVERSQGGDAAELRDAAIRLVRQSMQADPGNPLAMAFIADVHDLLLSDPAEALSLAERALAINPGTGYAHASLGALELRRGRSRDAMTASARARRQLENTSLNVFALMRYCVAAMSSGCFGEAEDAAEKASRLAPTSRPPMRHLYALKLKSGDIAGATEVYERLRKLEPDFSMKRIRTDPDFPASTIRKTGLDRLEDIEV